MGLWGRISWVRTLLNMPITIGKCDIEDESFFSLCETKEKPANFFLLSRLKGCNLNCLEAAHRTESLSSSGLWHRPAEMFLEGILSLGSESHEGKWGDGYTLYNIFPESNSPSVVLLGVFWKELEMSITVQYKGDVWKNDCRIFPMTSLSTTSGTWFLH